MKRLTRRRGQAVSASGKLNLVSLMDIFTILVFFLLLNSGDVQVLQAGDSIRLPDSVAIRAPVANLTIAIDGGAISVAGKAVISVVEAEIEPGNTIAALVEALQTHADNGPAAADAGLPVTVLGDRATSYALLKKIIATCSAANFRQVSLAVNRTAAPKRST